MLCIDIYGKTGNICKFQPKQAMTVCSDSEYMLNSMILENMHDKDDKWKDAGLLSSVINVLIKNKLKREEIGSISFVN